MSETPEEERPSLEHDRESQLYGLLATAAVALIATGTVVYHWLEDWSWVDSFYFSVVAVTTVGFGDFSPTSDGAKLFTVAYIVIGISLVASYLEARFKRAASRRAARSHR
jgi:hypothetical protein